MQTIAVPTSTLLAEYKRFTRDVSTENDTIGKLRINHYYGYLLSEANNYVTERTKYGDSKIGQRSYKLPPDYIKMKTVRFKLGDVWHEVEEVVSLEKWHAITGVATRGSIPYHWILINEQGHMSMEFDPIPDANGTDNIEVIYEGFQDPLIFPTDYTTGTLAISQGSSAVVGTGTTFTSAMKDRFLQFTNGKYWYEIFSYTDATHITLVGYFQEDTVSGVGYTIAELPRLPSEFHYTPVYAAVRDYYLATNADKAADFEKLYARDLILLQRKYQSKSKGAVTRGIPVNSIFGTRIPRNYPNSLIG